MDGNLDEPCPGPAKDGRHSSRLGEVVSTPWFLTIDLMGAVAFALFSS